MPSRCAAGRAPRSSTRASRSRRSCCMPSPPTASPCHDGAHASRGQAARAACPRARPADRRHDLAAGAHSGLSLGRPRGRGGLRLSGHASGPPAAMTVVLLLLLWAVPAGAATPRGLLRHLLARVCLQPQGPLEMAGEAVADATAEAVTNGPTSLAAMGGAMDAPKSVVGTIFLDRPATLGRGALSTTLLGQSYTLGHVDGQALHPPSQALILNQPPIVAARGAFDARIRQAALGLAATYGVRDGLDVSGLLPLVFTRVRVTATRQVTDVLGADGKFTPVRQPLVRRSGEASGVSQGDLTVRGKWWFLEDPVALGAVLAFQFPTGVPTLLTGTGHYWADPSLVAAWPLWEHRAELTAEVGMLVDLSRPAWSKVTYGVGMSAMLIPKRLGAVVELLGQSEIQAH